MSHVWILKTSCSEFRGLKEFNHQLVLKFPQFLPASLQAKTAGISKLLMIRLVPSFKLKTKYLYYRIILVQGIRPLFLYPGITWISFELILLQTNSSDTILHRGKRAIFTTIAIITGLIATTTSATIGTVDLATDSEAFYPSIGILAQIDQNILCLTMNMSHLQYWCT